MDFEVSNTKQIGIGLTLFGVMSFGLGIALFLDSVLLAIGNVLFLSGITLIIGIRRTLSFFIQKQKWKGSGLFFGGILIVLSGWSLIGIVAELWGFLLLFGAFLPTVVHFLRRLPVIGTLMALPGISQVFERIAPKHKLPV